MTNAEIKAHRAIPDETLGGGYTLTHKRERDAYVKGYNQAIEDLCARTSKIKNSMNKQIEQVKAEIERLKNQDGVCQNNNETADKYYSRGVKFVCERLLSFINSLPEEPVSEDLEEAAVEAFKNIVDEDRNSFLEIFKDGAQWKGQQMMEKAVDWLEDNFRTSPYDTTKVITNFNSMIDVINNFRQAMSNNH